MLTSFQCKFWPMTESEVVLWTFSQSKEPPLDYEKGFVALWLPPISKYFFAYLAYSKTQFRFLFLVQATISFATS